MVDFADFIWNFLDSLVDTFFLIVNFFKNFFDIDYFKDIFGYLPQPFSTIFVSLTSMVFVLVILFLIDKFLGVIRS